MSIQAQQAMQVRDKILVRTQEYSDLPLFQAFRENLIPVERLPEFFKEQCMASRWFQDLIWAITEIPDEPYADFAKEHRHRDSGHYRWMERDLTSFGIAEMTADDWFKMEWLPTRIQMARILARCHGATSEERMVILASLENAGSVTLGTIHDYFKQHNLERKTLYFGKGHAGIEDQQVGQIDTIAKPLLDSTNPRYLEIVDLVFDALITALNDGASRYYQDCLPARHAS